MTANGMTAVSLFAGIGGFDLALRRSGVRVAASVEIDPAARGVLRRHFPESKIFNDVREVTGDQLRAAGFVPGRGILCGGFPCQDLSVAGRRAGLGGARSGLFWEIMRLADELSPRWLVLENVPGLLSAVCPCPGDGACVANGRAVRCGQREERDGRRVFVPDVPHAVKGGACPGGCMEAHGGAMGTILGALGERGYGFAYRVLDAQFFGVPQRRRRVFVVGCLGDQAGPVEVLLEPEGGQRNPPQGGQARSRAASATHGGDGSTGVVGALTTGGLTDYDDNTAQAGQLIAHAITAREAKGADSDATSGFIVASTLQGGGRRGHRIDAEGAAGGHLAIAQPAVTSFAVAGNIADTAAVRRLAPIECERLQGFPDGWTQLLDDDAEQSDAARYRQCGNAVAVPVVEWIARRVAAMDQAREVRGAA
jgi:DNA (cytosine-5)-methyltransferase 1